MIATPQGAPTKKAGPPPQRIRLTFSGNCVQATPGGRRFPPFARKNAARLRDPNITIWVVVGTGAWSWAREREFSHFVVIVCPPGEAPAGFDWRLLAGHDPILLVRVGHIDGSQVHALIEGLVRDGTTRILSTDGTRYIAQEVPHAA